MSRIVRLSLALLFALMMVIATAGAALAFDPPDNAADGSAAAAMTATAGFPAIANGTFLPGPGGFPNAGPWHATECGPNPSPASESATTDGPLTDGPIAFTALIPPTNPCP